MPKSRPEKSAIPALNPLVERAFAMIALDRFFDVYDRFAPSWFSDVLVAALIIVPLALLI